MSNARDYDVIVVGGGNAALLAALAAHEEGAKVLVLEKSPPEWRGGNTYFTTGAFRAPFGDAREAMSKLMPDLSQAEIESFVIPNYTKDDFYNDVMRVTEGKSDPDFLELVVEEAMPTLEWMTEQGIGWEPRVGATTFRRGDKLVWASGATVFQAKGGGAGFSDKQFDLVAQRGIEVRYRAKVSNLLVDSRGRVYGVIVRTEDGFQEIKGKTVILGCGGFEANPEMRARYLGKNWDLCLVRGTPYNTGEMLKIALGLGAAPAGHYSGCHATLIDADTPQPSDRSMTDRTRRISYGLGIMVNINGERFLDEGEDLFHYTYAKYGQYALEQPRLIAFQIFDSKTKDIVEDYYFTGSCLEANSIRELAGELGIQPDSLAQTVEEFNASVQPGEFDPVRRDGKGTTGIKPVKSNWAQKLDTPPYVGYGVNCGITFTYGGIKANRQSQVINMEGEVIPGLYACGEIVGGLFFHNYPGGTGQLSGAVRGRIAGYNAAGEARE